jgi:hypothetical protein
VLTAVAEKDSLFFAYMGRLGSQFDADSVLAEIAQ